MLEETIRVVDDFFPKYEQKIILNFFTDKETDWYYKKNVSSYQKETIEWAKYADIVDTDVFMRVLDFEDEKVKFIMDKMKIYAEQKFKVKVKEFKKALRVFYPPNPLIKENQVLTPHVDQSYPHKNLLYYVNDNDAPTIFYNQKFDKISNIDYSNQTIIKTVMPKKGRAVLFDGTIFHSGNVSRLYPRLIINTNFIE